MPEWISVLLGTLLAALLKGFVADRASARDDAEIIAANRSLGAQEAGNETQAVIADIAGEARDLPAAPREPSALAARLRARATALRTGSGGGGPAASH